MRTIIAGSRGIGAYSRVDEAMQASGFEPTVILSGGAPGIDRQGEVWARRNRVRLRVYPADWSQYGRSAGVQRNVLMAQNADALVAIWDGKSKGTKHMIDTALRLGLKVYVDQAPSPSADGPAGSASP